MKILSSRHHVSMSPLSSDRAAAVAFMDITCACKAHSVKQEIDGRLLRTDFYDPSSGAPLGAAPGGGGQSGGGGVSAAGQQRLHSDGSEQGGRRAMHG